MTQPASKENDLMSDANESPETLADRRRVEDGYALVNAIWKTQGAAVALR